MSEYRCLITVNAAADDVFGFVCDLENLARYLPTVRHAEAIGDHGVHIVGDSPHGSYDTVGTIRVDENTRRMEWGSDAASRYRGWLQVAGDGRNCQLTVRLAFEPSANDDDVNVALRTALKRVKAICEGVAVPSGGVAYADHPPG